jgi:hypothetical protein
VRKDFAFEFGEILGIFYEESHKLKNLEIDLLRETLPVLGRIALFNDPVRELEHEVCLDH